jgi:K+-sensing histidine kinase KdpD
MDAFEILVIILSITLAIFLIIAIVVGVLLVRVLRKVEMITDRAESIITNIDAATEKVKQFAVPTAVMSMVTKMIKQYKNPEEDK